MGQNTARAKKKNPRKSRRDLSERRFESGWTNQSSLTIGGLIAGGLALGAGLYGQWMAPGSVSYAPWLVGLGAVLLGIVVIWGDLRGHSMRVGAAGVAIEGAGGALTRVPWCDIRSIKIRDDTARIEGPEGELTLRVSRNRAGTAWLVREAEERIPKRIEVDAAVRNHLPEPKAGDGVETRVEKTQVTGRRCRASDELITFERDARFCGRCGEVYHRDAYPEVCLTCEGELDKDT